MAQFIFALFVMLMLPLRAPAQDADGKTRPPSVTVNGEALVSVEPNQAEIDIGVVTQAKTAPAAGQENAARLSKVVAELKKLLGPGDELKTTGYSLSPNYRYPREGGSPEVTGYTATNIVRVTTGSLPSVSKFIDAAMQAGANQMQRLLFTLRDEEGAQREALRIATTKAKAKAEEVARALGLKVVRVLSVTEGERSFRPVMLETSRARAAEMQAQTPIEIGTVQLRSTVTLTAEVGR
jgi:uncharacterized protein YggE